MFHKNAEQSGLEGPQEFECALCDSKAKQKNENISKHIIREPGIFTKIMRKHC